MKTRILIFSSELAACFGRNKYISQEDAILRMIQRQKNELNKDEILFNKLSSQDKSDITNMAGKQDKTDDVLNSTKYTENKIKTEFVQKYNLNKEETESLIKHVKKIHYTEHGTKKEDSVRESVSDTLKINKDDKFRKKVIFEDEKYIVYVGGKSDGVSNVDGENVIVEIKNRMRKLFGYVPEYEKIQIFSYLYINECEKGLLIENHDKKSNKYDLLFDKKEWDDMIDSEIKNFLDIYNKVQCN